VKKTALLAADLA